MIQTLSYPDDQTQKRHEYLIKAWSCLPQGRTYTLRQADKKAREIGEERLLRIFRIISESQDINFRMIGKFLRRTSQFSHRSHSLVAVDRGNMQAWKLEAVSQPDTLPFIPKETETRMDPGEIVDAWRELPDHENGVPAKDAVRLATGDPGRFPKLFRIISGYGKAQRVRSLRNALRAAEPHLEAVEIKIKVGPKRRLRKDAKRRYAARAWIDPDRFTLKICEAFRLAPPKS